MAFPVTLNGRTYTLTDFEGTNYVDGLPDAFEDFVTHAGDIYNSTSTTSNSIGTGSKTFTVESNKPYQAGTPLRIADAAAPSTNFLDTVVTSYSGTTLVVNSIGFGGSGTKTSWTVNIGGAKTVDGTLGLSQGGTGATDAAGARTNIDVYSKADADSRFLNVSGEASDVTMNGNTTIGDSSTDTLTVRATTTFTNIGTGAAAGPYVNLLRDSSSPADDDFIGILSWQGKNDADQTVTYGQIAGRIADASDGSEDARIDLQAIVAGTTRSIMQYESGLTQFNAAGQDIDFRVHSTGNTHALFVDAGNDRVNVGNASGSYDLNVRKTNSGGDVGLQVSNRDTAQTAGSRALIALQADVDNDGALEEFLHIRGGTNTAGFAEIVTREGASLRFQGDVSTSVVFNDSGVNQDFRVEGDALTHALFVDATNSYVGVGESVPAAPLHVSTTAQNTALFDSSHTSGTQFFIRNSNSSVDSSAQLGFAPANDISGVTITAIAEEDFSTAANRTARLEIQTRDNGNFYDRLTLSRAEAVFNDDSDSTSFRVESNNEANMLVVNAGVDTVVIGGSAPVGNPYFSLQGESNNDAGEIKVRSNGYNAFKFRNSSNATVGSITINASSTSYNTTSDRRLKTDIQAINDATDRLMAMNPVSHKWIAEPDADAVVGFIAQEMEGIIPEAVSGKSDAEDMMGMDYGRITPVIVAALQEAITKIETLEARITALESK